jgi:hypothetical protein
MAQDNDLDERLFCSVRQATKILDCGERAIYSAIRNRDLIAIKVGNAFRLSLPQIRRLASGEKPE